jgi:hypothetical protein
MRNLRQFRYASRGLIEIATLSFQSTQELVSLDLSEYECPVVQAYLRPIDSNRNCERELSLEFLDGLCQFCSFR